MLCFGDHDSFMSKNGFLYTGLVDFVKEQLAHKYTVEIQEEYERPHVPIKDIKFPANYIANNNPDWQDRPYQYITARKAIHAARGVIEIATGGGKTEVAAIIIKWLMEMGYVKKVYFVAGTQFLMGQAADRFESRGLKGVGRMGAGNRFRDLPIQVCVIDSLYRGIQQGDAEIVGDFLECDLIFFDECHHLSAKSWTLIGEHCLAKFRFGLTATLWSDPFKFSYDDFYLIGLTGALVAHVPSSVLRRQGFLADPMVTLLEIATPPVVAPRGERAWDLLYAAGIVKHKTRNSVGISIARSLYEGGYKTLYFVQQVKHGLQIVKYLREFGCKNVHFVRGGQLMYTWMPSGRWETKKVSIKQLSEIVNDNDDVLIVGNVVMDEGIDVPAFNALIMGTAMKKYRRTVQRAGRGMRPKAGDNRVYIFDFIDRTHDTLLRHSEYRVKTYELEEFQFAESLEETCEAMGIPILLPEKNFFKWDPPKSSRKRRRRPSIDG